MMPSTPVSANHIPGTWRKPLTKVSRRLPLLGTLDADDGIDGRRLGNHEFDAQGYFGALSSPGFLLVSILVLVAAPLYLGRCRTRRPHPALD